MRILSKAGKKLFRNSLTGFTLIEILVVAVILSLFGVGILTVLNSSDTTWNAEMGLVQLQQQARQAMDRMIRELRQAKASSVNLVSSQDINFLIPGSGTNYIRYFLNDGQILREYPEGSGVSSVLGNNISSLDFSSLVSGVVKVQLQVQRSIRGRVTTFPGTGNLVEKVKLRN